MNKNSNKENKPQVVGQLCISKNINNYEHFLKKGNLNEDNIIWATNLRTMSFKNNNNSSQYTPDCFYRKTISFENKLKNKKELSNQANKPSINYASYQHLLRRKNNQDASLQNANFQISLRIRTDYSNSQHKQKFNTIPVNSRKESSIQKFLKKGSMTKFRFFKQDDYQKTFDGHHKYPAYSQKIVKEKNYNNLKHFIKNKGNNLPALAWQTGLRNY